MPPPATKDYPAIGVTYGHFGNGPCWTVADYHARGPNPPDMVLGYGGALMTLKCLSPTEFWQNWQEA